MGGFFIMMTSYTAEVLVATNLYKLMKFIAIAKVWLTMVLRKKGKRSQVPYLFVLMPSGSEILKLKEKENWAAVEDFMYI